MKRVLVVEDEMLVRELAVEDFIDAGFDVIAAADAAEAYAEMEADPDFALVFTDIRMPGPYDGLQLGQRIRTTWPAVPVVYATGYSEITPNLSECERLLRKPYRSTDLARVLTELGISP